jgi:L-lactate dehydrogenase complex protein LldF
MPSTKFKDRASVKLKDEFLRKNVKFTADRLRSRKQESADAFGHWEDWRQRGHDIRSHVIANLDHYLDLFSRNVERNGGKVHFAGDAAEAAEIVMAIVKEKNARLIAKSKSMVSEEVHINHKLEDIGVQCVETDLGEWIVQLAHETPSHIIIPAIHKNKTQIQQLFEKEGGEPLAPETKTLATFARRRLREKFAAADIGMTGCNFGIAETGSIALFSNEGNARMVSTLPKTHIVMMGMERIVPSLDDLEVMANLLPRSATGQKTTVYMSVVSGPRRENEVDGPEEMHVVILDNGRSQALADSEFREVLNCIRCGACLNVCPVYRQVGGHAYGSVYPGPIGAVISPLLNAKDKAMAELPFASSLCGACYEACPVKIPLHDLLVKLRRRYVDAGHAGAAEGLAMSAAASTLSSPALYNAAGKTARWVQLTMHVDRLPGPASGWTDHRDLPPPAKKSFRDLWPELAKDEPTPPRSSVRPGLGGGASREDLPKREGQEIDLAAKETNHGA